MTWVKALALDELWVGEMRGCTLAGRRVLLLRLDSGVYAYEDRCAHLGVPLSTGTLRDGVVTCGAHGFQFDALTGAGINPQQVRMTALPSRVEGDCVWVDPERRTGGLA